MGKYMKKGKITGDVAVMEIPQSTSSLGVRTRARTLALQPNPELSYLQLRSRRLEKPPFIPPPSSSSNKSSNPKHQHQQDDDDDDDDDGGGDFNNKRNPNNNQLPGSNSRVNSGSTGGSVSNKTQGCFRHFTRCDVADNEDPLEPSFGENNLDFDSRERSTRESTPCSLIRDSENIGTPGSTTRPTCSAAANRRARSSQRAIPTNPEMEEFFAGFELSQQKLFIEKYNYDVMNDMPLPGRYEWVRVDN